MSKILRKRYIILLLIFLGAFAVRILFISTLDNSVDVWGDWWDELGWKLATGKGFWVKNPYFPDGEPFYSWRTPGFPLFLAMIYKIFGHSYLAAKIGLAFISCLSVILLYLLGKELIDEKAGFVSAGIYSIYPASIFWTGYLAPVTLEIFFLFLLIYLLIRGEKTLKNSLFFFGGIILGIASCIRSLFLMYVPAVFLWLLIKNKKMLKREFWIFILGFCISISPWVIRNYKIFHRLVFTSTEGGIVCYIANNENSLAQPSGYWNPPPSYFEKLKGMDELSINRYLYREAFRFIKNNPGIYIKLVWDRFIRFWRFYPHTFSGPGQNYSLFHVVVGFLTFAPLLILGGMGVIKSFRRWKDFLLVYLVIFFWATPIILFFKTVIRYREPLAGFFILFGILLFKKDVER